MFISFIMNRLLFLGTLVGTVVLSTASCPSRQEALDCFYDKADLNHDGRISRHELEKSIDNYLPWWKRIPFKTFGGIGRIMSDCDANHDHFLTKEEANSMKKTCLNGCFKKSNTISVFRCN